MRQDFVLNEAVQFNENHKWCGVIGFVTEITDLEDDIRYMVAIPKVPNDSEVGTAPTIFIFVKQSENSIESLLLLSDDGRVYSSPPLTL